MPEGVFVYRLVHGDLGSYHGQNSSAAPVPLPPIDPAILTGI